MRFVVEAGSSLGTLAPVVRKYPAFRIFRYIRIFRYSRALNSWDTPGIPK